MVGILGLMENLALANRGDRGIGRAWKYGGAFCRMGDTGL